VIADWNATPCRSVIGHQTTSAPRHSYRRRMRFGVAIDLHAAAGSAGEVARL